MRPPQTAAQDWKARTPGQAVDDVRRICYQLGQSGFWMALGDSVTQKQGFTRMQMFHIANIYAVSAIVACVAGVFYWRAIGIF